MRTINVRLNYIYRASFLMKFMYMATSTAVFPSLYIQFHKSVHPFILMSFILHICKNFYETKILDWILYWSQYYRGYAVFSIDFLWYISCGLTQNDLGLAPGYLWVYMPMRQISRNEFSHKKTLVFALAVKMLWFAEDLSTLWGSLVSLVCGGYSGCS